MHAAPEARAESQSAAIDLSAPLPVATTASAIPAASPRSAFSADGSRRQGCRPSSRGSPSPAMPREPRSPPAPPMARTPCRSSGAVECGEDRRIGRVARQPGLLAVVGQGRIEDGAAGERVGEARDPPSDTRSNRAAAVMRSTDGGAPRGSRARSASWKGTAILAPPSRADFRNPLGVSPGQRSPLWRPQEGPDRGRSGAMPGAAARTGAGALRFEPVPQPRSATSTPGRQAGAEFGHQGTVAGLVVGGLPQREPAALKPLIGRLP